MELLPLLPSDEPANKQHVEVSATTLSRKNRILRTKSLTLHFIYQICNQDLANQPARLQVSIEGLAHLTLFRSQSQRLDHQVLEQAEC